MLQFNLSMHVIDAFHYLSGNYPQLPVVIILIKNRGGGLLRLERECIDLTGKSCHQAYFPAQVLMHDLEKKSKKTFSRKI